MTRRPTRESILDMIRRLLALGASPNENEAAAAIAKAEKMMAEYNVSRAEAEETDEANWQERVVWTGGGGSSNAVDYAIQICEKHFFIRPFYKKWRGLSQAIFFGQSHNLDVAEYVLNYLTEVFRDRWAFARRNFGYKQKHARGFYAGMAAGVATTLESQQEDRERNAAATNALVVIEGELTQRFQTMNIPEAKAGSPIDWEAGRDGYNAGVQVNIRPAVGGGSDGGAVARLCE